MSHKGCRILQWSFVQLCPDKGSAVVCGLAGMCIVGRLCRSIPLFADLIYQFHCYFFPFHIAQLYMTATRALLFWRVNLVSYQYGETVKLILFTQIFTSLFDLKNDINNFFTS